jgi:hypothetical protein
MEPRFLGCLEEAVHVSAREAMRFAVDKIQLRGSTGEIVATDARQLLIQGGFRFPWKEDLLIPATVLFGCRELPSNTTINIGRTDRHVCLRIGPWTVHLAIDMEGRFPDVAQVIPAATPNSTTCRVAAEDAVFLAKTLPRLPGRDATDEPVTVDLNGTVSVRARGEGQSQATEVILRRSQAIGSAVQFVCNRHYLARLLHLAFPEFQVSKADVPLVARDQGRLFMWMPLSKNLAIPAGGESIRIPSTDEQPIIPQPQPERSSLPMAISPPNGASIGHPPAKRTDPPAAAEAAPNSSGIAALIEEAQALRDVLRDAYGRSKRLVSSVKHQRQRSRLMASTLASLKQLQQLQPLDR